MLKGDCRLRRVRSREGDYLKKAVLKGGEGRGVRRVQFVQVADPWLMAHVLEVGTKNPDIIDKPRDWPLPVYNCFDRVSLLRPSCRKLRGRTKEEGAATGKDRGKREELVAVKAEN